MVPKKRVTEAILSGLFISAFYGHLVPQNNDHIYSTWSNLEVDKCGTAWLIINFVDPQAVFRFYPEGTLLSEGTPFDTPESRIRRTFNKTAFESAIEMYGLSDPIIQQMADIIKDIEVNIWGKKKYKISDEINIQINNIIKNSSSPEEALRNIFDIFCALRDQINSNLSNPIVLDKNNGLGR